MISAMLTLFIVYNATLSIKRKRFVPKGFTAGSWYVNDTVLSTLISLGFNYDCSAQLLTTQAAAFHRINAGSVHQNSSIIDQVDFFVYRRPVAWANGLGRQQGLLRNIRPPTSSFIFMIMTYSM